MELEVLKIDGSASGKKVVLPENNIIVVKGSVPGAKGSYLILEA